MTQIHDLKIIKHFFDDVKSGIKKFEVRNNDRKFKIGDRLRLQSSTEDFETEPINYIFYGSDQDWNGVKDGFVVLGFEEKPGAIIDEDVCKLIKKLNNCSLLPGSWDKRFIRGLEASKPGDRLTLKQLLCLGQMRYRYRKQIGLTK